MISYLRKYLSIAIILFLFLPSIAQQDSTAQINLQQKLPSNDTWWGMFGDPLLVSLIEKTIAGNFDLLNAMKNVEMAKNQLRIQRGAYYPELSLSGSYTPEKNSLGIEHINERNYTGMATLEASWEIDVFGSIRKSVRSQKELYGVSQENYRAVMVSLVAQMSSAYINLRTYQQQLGIARENLSSQKEVLGLTEAKFNAGLSSKLDVAQAKSLYLQTLAIIPGLESSVNNQINTICVLSGEFSDSLRQILQPVRSLPNNPGIPITGIPAELIRRRPDVSAAEKQMDALSATVGASRADWFPKFYITGSFGYGSDKFEHFFREENMDWQISPSIKWTFFSGRRLVESTRNAQLKLEEGINSYNNTLLTALQEVDNALYAYNRSLQQLKATREALVQTQETLELAIGLYQKGLVSYQNVLDSQRSVLSEANSLAGAESTTLLYMIQLYKVLGGGWEMSR